MKRPALTRKEIIEKIKKRYGEKLNRKISDEEAEEIFVSLSLLVSSAKKYFQRSDTIIPP